MEQTRENIALDPNISDGRATGDTSHNVQMNIGEPSTVPEDDNTSAEKMDIKRKEKEDDIKDKDIKGYSRRSREVGVEDSDTDNNENQEDSGKGNEKRSWKKGTKKKRNGDTRSGAGSTKEKSRKFETSHASSSPDSDSSSSSSSSSDLSSGEESDKRTRVDKKHFKKSTQSATNRHKIYSSSSSLSDCPTSNDRLFSDEEVSGMVEGVKTTLGRSAADLRAEVKVKKAEAALYDALVCFKMSTNANNTPPPNNAAERIPPNTTGSFKRNRKPDFKRIDRMWDQDNRNWKFVPSTDEKPDEADCVFSVHRKFTHENVYLFTSVDIKSSLLKESLTQVLKDVKGQSLEEETPSIDPNLLCSFRDEVKDHYRKDLKQKLKKERKKKQRKRLLEQISHCKLLVKYIDQDYGATRERLNAMLKAGNISDALLWALFKPNTIAYTTTYDNKDDPRCFKVDTVEEVSHYTGKAWWQINGHFLDYDGKKFAYGEHEVRIDHFKGTKKITSLGCFPLKFHKNAKTIKKELIERGKKFVNLQGMSYLFLSGTAYQKQEEGIAKFNVNSRIMVDPVVFRRTNPNYELADLSNEELGHPDDEGDDESLNQESTSQSRILVYKDPATNKMCQMDVPAGKNSLELISQKLKDLKTQDHLIHVFTEEQLLLASSVVLGFSFGDKRWLELPVSRITEIDWNEGAFDSLVLPARTKQNLKSMISSHRFNAAKTIDDVIQGKGKGLNIVLHGPPGVGKTLTAESIADFLKCPLYSISAGELGTCSHDLERDLNRIMDITHAWGAILLLDEADVFLEQRQPQDVVRNALVSVFLRLLEYYQGILFLTTNRVNTFDEAFQSRIHMGIRYEELNAKARREIWKHHVRKIETLKDQEHVRFTEHNYDDLSRKTLNGRQIKNAVITAQSCALAEDKPFSMDFVLRLLEVQEEFETDMKGGYGFKESTRHYN